MMTSFMAIADVVGGWQALDRNQFHYIEVLIDHPVLSGELFMSAWGQLMTHCNQFIAEHGEGMLLGVLKFTTSTGWGLRATLVSGMAQYHFFVANGIQSGTPAGNLRTFRLMEADRDNTSLSM